MRSVSTLPTTCTLLTSALAGTWLLGTRLLMTEAPSTTLIGGRSRAASSTSTSVSAGAVVGPSVGAELPDNVEISTAAEIAASNPNRTREMTAIFMDTAPDAAL